MRRVLPLAALSALVACHDADIPAPRPEQVISSRIERTARPWVIVDGESFEPKVTWNAASGEVELTTDYEVRFGDRESPEVRYISSSRLMARVPGGLAAGWNDVEVRSPNGRVGTLDRGLCGGETVEDRLVHACLIRTGIDTFRQEICETPRDGAVGSSVSLLPDVSQESFELFALSPDGVTIAYLGEQRVGATAFVQLRLARPWTDGAVEVVAEVPQAAGATQQISLPQFSPDGRTLVWIEEGRRLMMREVADEAGAARQLASADEADVELLQADVDAGSRWVLLSTIRRADPDTLVGGRQQLFLVDLAGGAARPLVPGSEELNDGPGVFLPDGDRVLMVSDRVGLEVRVDLFGDPLMVDATNLFIVDVASGEVEPVTDPIAMIYLLPPVVVSPDGRWAAGTAAMLDLSNSFVDMLITDLETGRVFRAERDDPGLCSALTPDACPTLDVTPAFSPDSTRLHATAIEYAGLDPVQTVGSYLYEVELPGDALPSPPVHGDWTLPPGRVTRLPRATFGFSVHPVLRPVLGGCD